jgi:hypothetical protein
MGLILAWVTMIVAQVPDLGSGGSIPPGASGWASAGLLTGVLGWLLFVHLPAKDKQMKEVIADYTRMVREVINDCDAHNAKIMADAVTANERQRSDFREALRMVTEAMRPDYSPRRGKGQGQGG